MLQAHSFLWNYLWVAPDALLLILGILLYRRGLVRQVPSFTVYAILSSLGGLALYIADVVPSISAVTFWRVDIVTLCLESVLKFVAIGEVFSRVFNPYPSISRLGKYSVSTMGALLVFGAAYVAAISEKDSTQTLISGPHQIVLSVFIVECGLVLAIFSVAAYLHLPWDRYSFGIISGFGFSSCVHLAGWAIANAAKPSAHQRILLDFLHMSTFHVTVLIWYYFLIFSVTRTGNSDHRNIDPPIPPSAESLDDWNRELERLIRK